MIVEELCCWWTLACSAGANSLWPDTYRLAALVQSKTQL